MNNVRSALACAAAANVLVDESAKGVVTIDVMQRRESGYAPQRTTTGCSFPMADRSNTLKKSSGGHLPKIA